MALKRTRLRRVSRKRQLAKAELVALRLFVLERDGYRCRYCRTRTAPLEVHHVIKRSQRPDLLLEAANCVTLCGGPNGCHSWVDASYSSSQGRLVIERHPGGYVFSVVRAANKFAVRAAPFLNGSANQASANQASVEN